MEKYGWRNIVRDQLLLTGSQQNLHSTDSGNSNNNNIVNKCIEHWTRGTTNVHRRALNTFRMLSKRIYRQRVDRECNIVWWQHRNSSEFVSWRRTSTPHGQIANRTLFLLTFIGHDTNSVTFDTSSVCAIRFRYKHLGAADSVQYILCDCDLRRGECNTTNNNYLASATIYSSLFFFFDSHSSDSVCSAMKST